MQDVDSNIEIGMRNVFLTIVVSNWFKHGRGRRDEDSNNSDNSDGMGTNMLSWN
jgi:hypothetical protein